MLNLIPMPKKIHAGKKSLNLNRIENLILPGACPASLLNAAVTLADEMQAVTGKRIRFCQSEVQGIAIRLAYNDEVIHADGYRMKITETGILLEGGKDAGIFYGIQTLRQLVRAEGVLLPGLSMEDEPDFEARGFYHDCTRGKVPTLKTLFQLVDKLAYYKLNQLQLYIEHTFAFARHSDMWSGADPLTAEEIIRLDHYCKERHIDLVPSLSTFGHFYAGLRSHRQPELNELDVDAPSKPFSFVDRMAHYTLNPSDPRSIELIKDLLAEFLPLFSSRYFNICCDETFDLGKGKNKAAAAKKNGVTKLYVSFLKKIIAVVKSYGKSVMFWGDIIADAPELIKELPKDTIPLEWDYGPEANWHDTAVMEKSKLKFYICPGVSGWNCFLNDIEIASRNIVNYAAKGLKYGASGLLNTDWGDYGHINLLANSYHGLALGAGCAWNGKACANMASFDKTFSILELGDHTGKIVAAWRRAMRHQPSNYKYVENLFDHADHIDCLEAQMEQIKKIPVADFRKAEKVYAECETEMTEAFRTAKPLDPLTPAEMLCGLRGTLLTYRILAAYMKHKGFQPREIADDFRSFEVRFAELWHKRNKPSEYYHLKSIWMEICDYLDSL